jgi:hypothetical protein
MYKIINNMLAINSENHSTKPTRKTRQVQNHSYAIPSATKGFRKWVCVKKKKGGHFFGAKSESRVSAPFFASKTV